MSRLTTLGFLKSCQSCSLTTILRHLRVIFSIQRSGDGSCSHRLGGVALCIVRCEIVEEDLSWLVQAPGGAMHLGFVSFWEIPGVV